jgi:hypothetical protein
MGFTYDS